MYEELVKSLREEAKSCEWSGCVQTADEMRQVADAIEKLNNSRWIPVTERLPERSGNYLLYRPHFWGANIGQHTICYWSGENWSDNYRPDAERFLPMIKGMYWMPLPQPLEEDNNDGKD